jgi:ubiquinone/menaquinone biosynthesis C-methylase UbiE
MAFDENWENDIYSKNRQINKFPFDWVVSTVTRLFGPLDTPSNISAVELGCGTGNNLKFLLDFGFDNVHGIDGSKTALQLAHQHLNDTSAKLKLIRADFASLPEQDGYFDLVLDRGSITHNDYDSSRAILAESLRILKSGGYIMSTLFSSSHSAVFESEQISKSFYKAFQSEATNNRGLNTSFFKINDVFELFSSFEIMSCSHMIEEEYFGAPYRSAMWYVIAKKP